MQRSTNMGRMTFGKRGKRYTPPSFMSKPKPLKSKEQLMEEIMLGTRDLPNLKKPLSAKFDESQMSSPTPSTGKSSISTASTMAMSERSPGPFQSSTVQDDNDIPPTSVLQTSSSQSELVSPLPTPLTSPVIPSPTSSPGALSRKSRSRRVQPHGKTMVSTSRTLLGARSLSDRRLQQIRTQGNQTSDPSMMPPAPSLETIESGIVLPDVSSAKIPSSTNAPRESKSPVARRKSSVRDRRSISDKKLQQLLSTQHKQVSDPSIVSAPPLEAKDPSVNVRTTSKSPTPRKRGSLHGARSISDRRLPQQNGQHAQASDTSVVTAPPMETKDKEDDKIALRSRARQSKSPVRRKRGSVRAARTSISDRRLPKTSAQPEQVANTSTSPVEANGDGDENELLVASSRSSSLRENGKKTRKRGNNRNSIRSPSLSNGEEEGKQPDLSLSLSSRGTVSSAKEASTSTRSSSSHSLPTLQSKRTADRTRRRRLRESLQRSRSGNAVSLEPKHPGFIKSFLGTSENGTLAEDDFVPMTLRKGHKAIRSGPL